MIEASGKNLVQDRLAIQSSYVCVMMLIMVFSLCPVRSDDSSIKDFFSALNNFLYFVHVRLHRQYIHLNSDEIYLKHDFNTYEKS